MAKLCIKRISSSLNECINNARSENIKRWQVDSVIVANDNNHETLFSGPDKRRVEEFIIAGEYPADVGLATLEMARSPRHCLAITPEQIEVWRNTTPKVPSLAFQLPFNVMEMDVEKWTVAIVQLFSDDNLRLFRILGFNNDSPADSSTTHLRCEDGVSLENAFGQSVANPFNDAIRVAVNACLACTMFGLTKTRTVKPHRLKGKRKASQQQPTYYYQIDQDVDIRAGRASTTETEADGSPKRPHWRRGHYKMQAYGPQHSLRRMIFIAPVLVNAGQFRGEVARTTTRHAI